MNRVTLALTSFLCFLGFALSVVHEDGFCAMYDNCGKKSLFGSELPCVNNTEAVKPSKGSIEILNRICGADFPMERVCCSEKQLLNLESNLKKVDPLISSCPACRKNFYDFFCKFTCSSNQSTFIDITKTSESIDQKKEIVTELSQFVDSDYASEFFNSCKEVKFSATNGYAMDLIGGGATNYKDFLKFLGDEKPLLGGSPFQINYEYATTERQQNDGIILRSGDMKSCDDKDYKCACSDCSNSCPKLPGFKSYDKKCTIGVLPCFSFAIIILWGCLILILGGYHISIVNSKKNDTRRWSNSLIDDDDDDDVGNTYHFTRNSNSSSLAVLEEYHMKLIGYIQTGFEYIGYYCALLPGITIGVCIVVTLFMSSGLFWLSLEINPINLWVSPEEPALKNLQFFEQEFGEWFRIEQIIISSSNESQPILNWENIQWWFEKEQELRSLTIGDDENFGLTDLCFKPMGDDCAIESFAQYFQGDIKNLKEDNWKQQLKSCTDSPVNCLPTFQQPLKKNLLFDKEDIFDSKAFVITLLINNNLSNIEYTSNAVEYEHALKEWIFDLRNENTNLKIDFSTEVSLTEELNKSTNMDISIIIVSYLLMFLYASLALGGKVPTSMKLKDLVHTRFQLGLGGIFIILLSVTSSAGIFSMIGLKSTLIIAEVIPFLILAVGIDNIFLIVHELHLNNKLLPDDSIEYRISQTLKNVGPSCLISAILQFAMFLLATRVEMPAVKNFAFYSAGAIMMNFILQMTGFIALLALDQRRLEDDRIDCVPCIQVDEPISLSDDDSEYEQPEEVEYNFSKLIDTYYAPFILSRTNKPKILTFFLLWLGISLSLLPNIQFGLDQRIAIPSDSYLIDYFNSVYKYLNVGPPIFFVMKNLDVTERENQQKLCGKFSTCNEFSVSNILEQELKRSSKSTIAEPASSWLDDFLTWLNPDLDQCCRFKKNSPFDDKQFCTPSTPERLCEACYTDHDPQYSNTMEGFPTGKEFMFYFNQWIEEPSDPCPLGGKAPYSTSISVNRNKSKIDSSYFRSSHSPLRSQADFINAHKNSLRIVREIESYDNDLDMFAFSPFYIFFVQYESIVKLTLTLLLIAAIIIWCISAFLLGSVSSATILVVTVCIVLVNIGGVMSLWSISLNAVSLVNLVICAGLAVEFTIHITRAFTITPPDIYSINPRENKAHKALTTVGGSVLGGITLTKFIGISVLAFTKSKIFEVYYFRMWLALVFIAAIHALCLLPILLSYFGGSKLIISSDDLAGNATVPETGNEGL